ncbi:MAG: DNA primase [Marinifilaceae bacterium]|jgi:DNA primase|nr:DNA primase [Marinifilaceae bacterium]
MIDQNTIAQIFETADILEVVSDFVSLRKRGVNYLGLCPFHNEKTPSFTVSPAKGIYKCFGCGKGGNAVNFIMEHEQLDYVNALKYLAKKFKIDIVEEVISEERQKKINEREGMMIVNKFALEHFMDNLNNTEMGKAIAKSYFKQRGFNDESIEKFQLGYCQDSWNHFSNAALDRGYKKEFLTKTGLSIEREDKLLDRFKARVIFPIHGIGGRPIAFGGRTLKNDKKTAKYLNSPESEVYHKSKVLYGIFQAKKSISLKDKCFLVEGYTDVISLHQAGIENVVASSGTALTVEQILLIKRFTENITIIFDGDAAGIKAALRGIDLILHQAVNVKILALPDGEDPDSFAKSRSPLELESYIEDNEQDFIHFKTGLLKNEAKNDPIKRASLITEIVRSIAIIPNGIVRTEYVKSCSELLNVPENTLYTEIRKLFNNSSKSFQNYLPKENDDNKSDIELLQKIDIDQKNNKCYIEEQALIRILFNYHSEILFREEDEDDNEIEYSVLEFIIKELDNDDLNSDSELYDLVFNEFRNNITNPNFDAKTYFRDHENKYLRKFAVDILSEPYELSDIWKKKETYIETEQMKLKELVPKLINEYKVKKVINLMSDLMMEMRKAQANNDFDLIMKLIEKKKVLDEIKKMISKELGDRTILN